MKMLLLPWEGVQAKKNEKLEKFVEDIWAPQYFRSAKKIVKSYENSRLPLKFIKGQKWLLTPLWSQTDQMRSVYDLWEDMVIEDIDTTLMPLGETAFGCCIGGKILAVVEKSFGAVRHQKAFAFKKGVI